VSRRRGAGAASAEDVAAAVRALAASLRSGLAPRVALMQWPESAAPGLPPALRKVARRVSLGESPEAALATATSAIGSAAGALRRCLALHRRCGGSLPALLDGVAAAVERAEAARRRAGAATAGARLSARLVAGLPLAFVPLTSGGRVLTLGVPGASLLAAGIALAVAGLYWIGRLVPRTPDSDAAAGLADELAVALGGGIPLPSALEALAADPPGDLVGPLARVRRRTALGDTWIAALRREGRGLAGLAQVLETTSSRGLPAAAALRAWAEVRRAESDTELRRSLARAPVLMVVPLTVCVLPSFALLAFGPFVLGAIRGA
jgi:tight adherence protein B